MAEVKEEKQYVEVPFPFVLNWGPKAQIAGEPVLSVSHALHGVPMPQHMDLREHCSGIKNQGALGACTAFAGCAAMEYIWQFALSREQDLSERFLYYNERVADGMPPWNDAGSFNTTCAQVVQTQGVCLEATFPYSNDIAEKPLKAAYQEALKYRAVDVARVDESQNGVSMLTDIRTTLAKGLPMIGGFICFDGIFLQQTRKTGIIPMPTGTVVGGHAVFFVGYDDVVRRLTFKNSWGDWGDGGFGYLPYEFVEQGYASDFWVFASAHVGDLTDQLITIRESATGAPPRFRSVEDASRSVSVSVSVPASPVLHADKRGPRRYERPKPTPKPPAARDRSPSPHRPGPWGPHPDPWHPYPRPYPPPQPYYPPAPGPPPYPYYPPAPAPGPSEWCIIL